MLLRLLIAFFSIHVHATDVDGAKPFIWTRGNYDYLKTRLPANTFRFEDPQAARRRRFDEDGYLPPLERDALFRKLNLETKLQSMDELDKDMLVMGAKAYTVPELAKQYPMLSLRQLRRLKSEVEKFK